MLWNFVEPPVLKACPGKTGGNHFWGKRLSEKRPKNINDNCLGVFKFDASLRCLFGFCRREGGWGGGETPKKNERNRVMSEMVVLVLLFLLLLLLCLFLFCSLGVLFFSYFSIFFSLFFLLFFFVLLFLSLLLVLLHLTHNPPPQKKLGKRETTSKNIKTR